MGDGKVSQTKAEAMTAFSIDMNLGGNSCIL
jgi:hypothetical protein